ncbi:branched-chain amino acid ABC transporter permease [Lactiplantibacillus paraplantarum]|uniref:branched-chain amino acid ABC transporter permease n=1 Tax=Lactiplantibacillus paraplantarum TaxID=60520 RepID=UPI0020739C64|nr:branched-chain amino acid ABC transporter permease [Lactiplantibacillus paraplantarum]
MKANLKTNLAWLGIMVAGFVIIDGLELMGIINSFIENMLVTIGINVILAVGLNLVIGFAGQFSLGHAGFMAIGAYATGMMTQTMATPAGFFISMIVGMVIVGIPTLRLRGDYLAIATMGAAEIIRILINNLKITNGAAGLFNIPALASWATVYVLMCLTTIVTVNFIHSRGGRAVMAVRDDELAAGAMGINTTRWKLAAFVFGAATAAIGGSLHAAYIQTIAPGDFNIMASIAILIIVVLGGVGSITGTFVAAIVLGALDTILQNFGTIRMIIYSLALILIMIFKPAGLLGTWEFSFANLFKRRPAKEAVNHD